MTIPSPFAQQSSWQPIAPNLSVRSAGDQHIGNSLTIIGSVHSLGDPNISNDQTLLGDLSTTGSVTLDGVIEGNIYCTSLIIMANGRVNGGIVALQDVIVQGKVTGAIRSRRVMLKSSAKVEGDIFYQRIGIDMGAHHDGMLHRTEYEHVCDEPSSPTLSNEDNSDERQTKASSNRGEPNRRFSMHDHEQKRYREDVLGHESGVCLPAE